MVERKRWERKRKKKPGKKNAHFYPFFFLHSPPQKNPNTNRYGWHFPELAKVVPDNYQYARVALVI